MLSLVMIFLKTVVGLLGDLTSLLLMCRIRFGLAGIHFEDFEGCHPVEKVVFQPIISSVPPVVACKTKRRSIEPDPLLKEGCVSSGKRTSPRQDENVKYYFSSFPFSFSLNADFSGDSKPVLRVVSGGASLTSSSSRHDDEHNDKVKPKENINTPQSKSLIQAPPPAANKVSEADRTESLPKKTAKAHSTEKVTIADNTSLAEEEPLKTVPPAKQVRFSDMIEERIIKSDLSSDSSSNSSYDSYTDPLPVNEDAVVALPSAAQSQGPMLDDSCGRSIVPSSSTGSGIDVRNTWTASHTPKRQRSATPGSSESQSPASLSWGSSDLESNIDLDGQECEGSRFHRQRALSPFTSSNPGRDRRTRFGEVLPEPIFVIRSKTHNYVIAGKSEEPQDAREPEKALSSRDSRAAATKQQNSKKKVKYKAPSASDDAKENAQEIDGDLSVFFREV